MRRTLILVSASLLLVSCSLRSNPDPAEVLSAAAKASRSLESAHFSVKGTASTDPLRQYSFAFDGILRDAGEEVQTAGVIEVKNSESNSASNIELEVIVGANRDVNVRVGSVSGDDPLVASPALRAMEGAWYRLPSESGASIDPVSPDPQLLRLQAEVVKVTHDYGTENVDGADAYHYAVSIDPQKLEQFLAQAAEEQHATFDPSSTRDFFIAHSVTGDLWIDQSTSFVRRIRWIVSPKDGGSVTANVTISLTDHNEAPEIQPPQNVRAFDPRTMLQMPLMMEGQETSLPPELEEQLMNSLFLDR